MLICRGQDGLLRVDSNTRRCREKKDIPVLSVDSLHLALAHHKVSLSLLPGRCRCERFRCKLSRERAFSWQESETLEGGLSVLGSGRTRSHLRPLRFSL